MAVNGSKEAELLGGPMLEIPLYAGGAIALITTAVAVAMMRDAVKSLALTGPGSSSTASELILTFTPADALLLAALGAYIAPESMHEQLGLLLGSIGSLSLVIPVAFGRALNWCGPKRMGPDQFGLVLLFAVFPYSIVLMPFIGIFLFDPWTSWHIASIPVAGVLIPAAIAFALPSDELEKVTITTTGGEEKEILPLGTVLMRLVMLEAPIMFWFMAGFAVL